MSELRTRRTGQTRAEIVEAAIGLFIEKGFEETSMQDVADKAGVSRRTVYRYFETKDDLVFEAPRQWLAVLNEVIDQRRPGEPTRSLCRRGLLEVAAFIEQHAESVLAGFSVLVASPSLQARHGRSDAEWSDRYLELIGPDVVGDPQGPLRAATAAMSLVAAQNALIAVWAAGHRHSDLVQMTHTVLDQVDSIWPEQCR